MALCVQMGFNLSRATCGRLLAQVREVYGYEKPRSGGGGTRAMPFAASERHEVWSADVRYLNMVDESETLGDEGWLKALRLDDYAPRGARHPKMLQQALFAYTDAI